MDFLQQNQNMNLTKNQKRHITVLLFLLPFLLGAGIDLYVPSLPAIANYYHAQTNLTQLTVGAYMLAFGVGSLFLAILSDSFGRKKIILISAIVFALVSFLSAFAVNIYLLIFYRALQGFAAAGFASGCRIIASDCFVGKDLAKALTYFAIAWALGPIVGPVIGAYLQHYFNWQADFIFFGFYGLLIYIYTLMTLPETHLILTPFQPLTIYRNIKTVIFHSVFLCGSALLAVAYAILVVFNILGPFLMQVTLKYSVVAYGQMALLLGFGYFLGGLCNRLLIVYFRPMQLVLFGIVGCMLTSLVMMLLAIFMGMNLYIILLPVLLLLLFCGLIFPNMLAEVIGLFPQLGGTSNAILGVFMAVGGFLFTATATVIPTTTQIPMALTYGTLALLCLILYFGVNYFAKKITC